MPRSGLVLCLILLALPVQAQQKDCEKTKASCAEGSSWDPATQSCVKVTS